MAFIEANNFFECESPTLIKLESALNTLFHWKEAFFTEKRFGISNNESTQKRAQKLSFLSYLIISETKRFSHH